MFANPSASWYFGSPSTPQAGCEHCGGAGRHEKWCITRDAFVRYAYTAVLDPERLTLRDRLILHALGVSWAQNMCPAT